MFRSYEEKNKSLVTKKPKENLTKIIPPGLLLAEEKRAAILMQIKENLAWEDSRFTDFCLNIIHNLTNYCQNLPDTSTSYYSQSGGFLDHVLNRTEAALELFKHYLVQESNAELSQEQRLWQYALFSASVLQGIGKLYLDYNINLYDSNALFLKKWNPLLGSLVSVSLGNYYHYEFREESDLDFRRRINLLLARGLMPAAGFDWIVSNEQVLAVWLALLNEDPNASGTLGAILIRADSIAIARYFKSKNQGLRNGRYGRAGTTFSGRAPESIAEKEQKMGMDFIDWLTEALNPKKGSAQITINQALLFTVPAGMIMSVEAFKFFVQASSEYKNWQAVQNGFLSLGLHRSGADGTPYSRFEQTKGIALANSVILPNKVQLYDRKTEKTTSVTAAEILSNTPLAHLNVEGVWQLNAEQNPTHQHGIKTGG